MEGKVQESCVTASNQKTIFVFRGYILLLLTYGMNVGVFYAVKSIAMEKMSDFPTFKVSTLLNTSVVAHFKHDGATEDAGWTFSLLCER